MSGNAEPGFLRLSWGFFLKGLPSLLIAFVVTQYGIEWLRKSPEDFSAWVQGHWGMHLCILIACAAVAGLGEGYKKWLGPSYAEWRRESRND